MSEAGVNISTAVKQPLNTTTITTLTLSTAHIK